jgi:hypothetical protein
MGLKINYMKVKHVIVILFLAYIFEGLGFYFKMMHFPGAAKMLLIGTSLKVIASILGIWKLLSIKDFSDFLNR